ncbi:MAG: hypothetical protein HPY66_0260 [Firmicutes bacterium]|nr:hypothetical protein [Bacillota bacterium]MDI6704682.1 flagellar biosynthetic protein FliO [Bacillota bacterium]
MEGFISLLLKVIYFIVVFGIIIFFAYYITRLLGRKVSSNSGKYMKVVDFLHVGTDRTLVIVKVGNEYILLASTAKGLELIKTIDGFGEDVEDGERFTGYLDRYSKSYKGGMGAFKALKRKFTSGDGRNEEL